MKIFSFFFLFTLLFSAFPANASANADSLCVMERVPDGNTTTASAEATQDLQRPGRIFTAEASWTGDLALNMAGGIKRGANFLGMANLKLGFDTQNAGLWKGGQLFVNAASTHGQSPSAMLTGDFQGVSNIEAGNRIFLHEWWYAQQFGRFTVIAGLQDLNAEMAVSENGSAFLNSSFGIPPVISGNLPAPIFPLTAPGITLKAELSAALTFTGALYDGCPTAFEHNAYNLRWHLRPEDGLLTLAEMSWSVEISQLSGIWKAGFYYHSGLTEVNPETGVSTEVFENNKGFYLLADQQLWRSTTNHRSLSLFLQLAMSTAAINDPHLYAGGGLNFAGLSQQQPDDAVGIALAHAGFKKGLRPAETAFELYYRKHLGKNLFLQPDLQYVVHPSGTGEALDNALVGFLRLVFFVGRI